MGSNSDDNDDNNENTMNTLIAAIELYDKSVCRKIIITLNTNALNYHLHVHMI